MTTLKRLRLSVKTNETDNDNKSLFSYLPNECLSYVCGYLKKWDIREFKLTSKQNAIVCLEEMQKILIGTLNMNDPFNNTNEFDLNNLYHLFEHVKKERHTKTKRFHSLFEEWELKYNIPQKYQLIFQLQPNKPLSLINSKTIRLTQISNNSNYLIIDKRNTIIWNTNKSKILNNEKFDKIIILEYFNVYTQQSYPTQIIVYKITDK
eukprot:155043_1